MAKFQVGDRVAAVKETRIPVRYTVVPSKPDDGYAVRTVSDEGSAGLWKEGELRLVSRKERRPQVVTVAELQPGDVVTTALRHGYVTVEREVETAPQYPAEPTGDVFVVVKARKATATGRIMVGKFGNTWYTYTYRDGYQFQGTWSQVCEHLDIESIQSIYKEEK